MSINCQLENYFHKAVEMDPVAVNVDDTTVFPKKFPIVSATLFFKTSGLVQPVNIR